MRIVNKTVLKDAFLFSSNMFRVFSEKFPGVDNEESLKALFEKIHMQSEGDQGIILNLLEISLEKILLNKEDANFIRGSDQNTEAVNQMFEDDNVRGLQKKD